MLSQDGAHDSAFVLYPDQNDEWTFGMSRADSTTPYYDLVTNSDGKVAYGAWQHITATYNKAAGLEALYVDGSPVDVKSHTSTWSETTGHFVVGRYLDVSASTRYYNGEVANVQVWNQTLTPGQVAALSGTPNYIIFPSDNTNYASGSTWTARCATMTFTAGLLSVRETCSKSATVYYGASGYPDAVLVLQADGNLVIYKTSTSAHTGANALWASATYSHPGDALFLQPDGNLVIYDTVCLALWSSGTFNYE